MTVLNIYKALAATSSAKLDPIAYAGAMEPKFEKIVVIMDESIRAEFISPLDQSGDVTPFLASIGDATANFGIASSAANCSIPSRLSFRHMLRQSDLASPMRDLLTRTTVWQYARRAGYRTVHFDAFGSSITLTSGMGQNERSFVDQRVAIMEMPHYKRDMKIAQDLIQALRKPGRTFIFVEKFGSHVPYPNVYPPNRNVFVADVSKEFNLSDHKELIKHYKNAVNWTVDGFFQALLKEGLPPDTLLMYTSDHGQSLSEGGIKLSHCSFAGKMRYGEAAVPLLAFSTKKTWLLELRESAKRNWGRTSHYNIAPTVLLAMGYDRPWVSEVLDPSLLDSIPSNHRRLVRFGDKPAEFLVEQ